MWNRALLKQEAKTVFTYKDNYNYWKFVLGALILAILSGAVGSELGGVSAVIGNLVAIFFKPVTIVYIILGLAIRFFAVNPIVLGAKGFYLRAYDRTAKYDDLLDGFKNNYLNNVVTLVLRDVFTFLWSCLFVIPGIIKMYEYRMIPYIISENPDISYSEAFKASREMMMGNKWKAFVFDLSFIGWYLLNALTCGILGIFFVNPYYYASDANLYRAIKKEGSAQAVEKDNSAQAVEKDNSAQAVEAVRDSEENVEDQ